MPKKTPPLPRKAPGIPPSPPPIQQRKRKTFTTNPWTGSGQGEKIGIYGGSGVGKTSLAAIMPNPIFLGVDDGGRKIRHPVTGEPLQYVEGVETFEDTRDALAQTDLWPVGSSCVIDTFTVLENLAEPYMFKHLKHEKGQFVSSLEGYGYGKGYTHLFETMRLILQDLDQLVRRGVNVCLICQNMAVKRANPGGMDFLEDGPKLSHPSSEKNSVRLHMCEWADHIFRVGYYETAVQGPENARVGKIIGSTTRAIYTMPEVHFFAKTRTLTDPVVSFETPEDDSIWRLLFPEQYPDG